MTDLKNSKILESSLGVLGGGAAGSFRSPDFNLLSQSRAWLEQAPSFLPGGPTDAQAALRLES